jgi:putative transposase
MTRWPQESDYRRGRTCVFRIQAHLVFVTKRRRGVLTAQALVKMEGVMREACASAEAKLVKFNGEDDHVHLLVDYPPKLSLSVLVNRLKGLSSRILRRDLPNLGYHKALRWSLWSPSWFGVSCGGAPLEVIKAYIDGQRRPTS